MKQRGISATMIFVIFLVGAAGLRAAGNYRVLYGPDKLYYGHISYTEAKGDGKDPIVIREGQVTGEVAVLNLPLGPGDTVRTPADRRVEVQFDTGTIVRLDFDTELKLETINAQSLSAPARLSNLALARGRVYVMYKEYDSRETFQLLTSVAALKMSHKTVATIGVLADGSTDVQVKYGKVNALLGRDEKSLEKQSVKGQERLVVSGAGQAKREAYVAASDFEVWNDGINARFVELHQDQSPLPKPLQKLPDAVQYFAQTYGNIYGEWVWADLVGYVWRPYLDRQDYPGWRPNYVGSWTSVGGQLFWVPDEPWGWVPYHLGIWQWDKKLGWVWLPGSMFAPAWVEWEFYFGYFGWRPWSLYDWYDGFYLDAYYMSGDWYYTWPGFRYFGGTGSYYPYYPDGYNLPGTVRQPELDRTPTGALQRSSAPFLMPREYKDAYKNVLAAYKKGDPSVIESMKQVPSQISFVAKAELNRADVQGRTVSWKDIPKPAGIPSAKGPASVSLSRSQGQKAAARTFRANDAVSQILHGAEVPGRVQRITEAPAAARPFVRAESGPQRPGTAVGERGAGMSVPMGHPRFLDWNPDVKVARTLGVHIEYSSRGNEVRCPDLHLSSSDRLRGASSSGMVPTLGAQGVSYEPAGAAGMSGSGGPSAGSPQGSRTSSGNGPGSGARASGGEGSSSSGGGGGKIKN